MDNKLIVKLNKLLVFLLFFSIFLFISPLTIHAATYYVSPSGSNTNPYDTWEKAANLPSTVITHGNSVAGPHTVYIAPGSYSNDNMYLTDSDWTDGTILGTSAHGSISPASKDQVIISKATSHVIYAHQVGITIKYLSATGSDSGHDLLYIDAADFTGEKLHLYNSGRRTITLEASNASFSQSIFEGANTTSAIYISGSGSGIFSYNLMTNSTSQVLGTVSALRNAGSGSVTLYNNIILGSHGRAIHNSATGTINATNNILLAGENPEPTVLQENGTINLNNNILVGHWSSHSLLSGTIATDTGNIKNYSPGFVRRQRSAYLVPAVDDSAALSYTQSLETELASRGLKGTYYIEGYDFSSNQDAVQTLLDNGTMSIGAHSYSHSWVSLTGDTYSITKAGATVNVDRTNNQIVITPGGTVSSFRTKSLATIQSELETLGCTVGSLSEGFNNHMLGEAIADSSGAQASPYTPQLLIDTSAATGLYKTEIADAKSIMESALTGYTGKSFATPGGASSEDAETAMKNVGFLRNRNLGTETSTKHYLYSVNMYENEFFLFENIIKDSDDDEVRANSVMLFEFLAQHGAVMDILSHSSTEGPIDQWTILFDTAQDYSEVSVTSSDEVLDEIINSGNWTTSDQITYTRTWTDQADYSLNYTSPGIDAGTDVSLTTDYDGNPVYGSPDIGAYEYQPPFTGGTDEMSTSTVVRLYGDEKFRNKTAPTDAITADLSVALPDSDRSQWLDIDIATWENSGTRHKYWTESTTLSGVSNTSHVVGDLEANKYYNVKVDSVLGQDITGDNCTNGVCLSNSQGRISFTYTGEYSDHVFDVEAVDDTTPASNTSPAAPVCTDQTPGTRAPWLYKAIAQGSSSILLYFTEADGPLDKYVLKYGTSSENYQYGVQDMGVNSQASMEFLVESLSPDTTYYFRVRAGNGCATGPWSNEISVKTKSLSFVNQLDIIQSELKPIKETPEGENCQTYIVEDGDSLWSIASKVLGDGDRYKEIVELNKSTYPSLENSTLIHQGWKLKTVCVEETQTGYDIKIKVVNTKQEPVKGVKVTLYSKVQETITNEEGIAEFNNVEPGNHKVMIAYKKLEGEQSINLAGDVKGFDLDITIREKTAISSLAWLIIGVMGVVVIMLSVLLIKAKK